MPRRWSGGSPEIPGSEEGEPGRGWAGALSRQGHRRVEEQEWGEDRMRKRLAVREGAGPGCAHKSREPRGAQATGTLETHLTRRDRMYTQAEELRYRK